MITWKVDRELQYRLTVNKARPLLNEFIKKLNLGGFQKTKIGCHTTVSLSIYYKLCVGMLKLVNYVLNYKLRGSRKLGRERTVGNTECANKLLAIMVLARVWLLSILRIYILAHNRLHSFLYIYSS